MKYEYKFVVEGTSANIGKFVESGEGVLKADVVDYDNEVRLHAVMLNEAIETFIVVTQPVKGYKSISELKVTINEIREL